MIENGEVINDLTLRSWRNSQFHAKAGADMVALRRRTDATARVGALERTEGGRRCVPATQPMKHASRHPAVAHICFGVDWRACEMEPASASLKVGTAKLCGRGRP